MMKFDPLILAGIMADIVDECCRLISVMIHLSSGSFDYDIWRIAEIRRFVRPHDQEREKRDQARQDQAQPENSEGYCHERASFPGWRNSFGSLTLLASPNALSPQMIYQPKSICHHLRPKRAVFASPW
jgi:hypothetical protein